MKRYDITLKYTLVEECAEPIKCDMPAKMVAYMNGAFDASPMQEQMWVILLNRKNAPIGRQMVTMGTLTCALAHPREIFRAAILAGAAAIACAHNHPSGDPSPSAADLQITRILREAGKIMDIPLVDHVIIGEAAGDPVGRGYYSFREAGMI